MPLHVWEWVNDSGMANTMVHLQIWKLMGSGFSGSDRVAVVAAGWTVARGSAGRPIAAPFVPGFRSNYLGFRLFRVL